MIAGLRKVYWLYKTECDTCRACEQTFEPTIEQLVTGNGARWIPRNLSGSRFFDTVSTDGSTVQRRKHRGANHTGTSWVYDVRDKFNTPSMVVVGQNDQRKFIDVVEDIIDPAAVEQTGLDINILHDRLPRIKRSLLAELFEAAISWSDYDPIVQRELRQAGNDPFNLKPTYEQGTFKRTAWDDALGRIDRLRRGVVAQDAGQ